MCARVCAHVCVHMCVHGSVVVCNHLAGGRCRHLEDRHSVEVTGLRDLCLTHEHARSTMRERITELEQNVAVLSAAKRDSEVCCSSEHAILSVVSTCMFSLIVLRTSRYKTCY